jgi:hypothetical protein
MLLKFHWLLIAGAVNLRLSAVLREPLRTFANLSRPAQTLPLEVAHLLIYVASTVLLARTTDVL